MRPPVRVVQIEAFTLPKGLPRRLTYEMAYEFALKPDGKRTHSEDKMKILAIAVLTLALVAPARAQEAAASAEQLNALVGDLHTLQDQIKNMDDSVFPDLKKRRTALDDTDQQVQSAFADLKAKYADLNTRIDEHQAEMNRHNAATVDRKCKTCVDAYDEEANSLDLATTDLQKEKTRLDAKKAGLTTRLNQLTQDMTTWLADAQKAVSDFDTMAARVDDDLAHVPSVAAVYGACANKYPRDDDAGLRQHCGRVDFDDIRATVDKLQSLSTPSKK